MGNSSNGFENTPNYMNTQSQFNVSNYNNFNNEFSSSAQNFTKPLPSQQQTQNLLTNQFYRSTSFNAQTSLNKLPINISGQQPIVKQERDLAFLMKMNKPENKNQFQQSLAETLRIRREHQEKIEQERSQYTSLPRQNLPKESDSKGTAFRIRPQTPRLNLLKNRPPPKVGRNQRKPEPLERRVNNNLLAPIDHELFKTKIKPLKQKKQKVEVDLEQVEVRDDLSEDTPKELTTDPNEESGNQEDLGIYNDQEDDAASVIDQGKYASNAGGGLFSGFDLEDFDDEEIENAIELNELFLSQQMGVKPEELARLTKIELRVDTTCHNLQATGEILSGLEYLKMNDSVIKCFRDIGTSFRFLEELYISYNFIEELFDIGFLEHLTVLDIEGNNIKSLDQIYYLKRNPHLTDVNLKYNPVTKEVAYYQRVQECVPKIKSLDDEEVQTAFFDRKTEEYKKINLIKTTFLPSQKLTDSEFERLNFIQAFIRLGADLELMKKWGEEAVEVFEKEPEEEELLIKAIKNYSIEKKAQQSYYDNIESFDNRPQTPIRRPMSGFRRTASEGFGYIKSGDSSIDRKKIISSGTKMRSQANNSFYKSTAISTQESFRSLQMDNQKENQNDSHVSDLVSNSDQVLTGNPLSLIRGRQQQKQRLPLVGIHTSSGEGFSKDIQSLINDFHQDSRQVQVSRDKIRDKFTQNSLKSSSKVLTSQTIGNSIEETKDQDDLNLRKQNSGSGSVSILQQLNLGQKKIGVKTAFNMGSGPIKADRIVLKTSDISFNKKPIVLKNNFNGLSGSTVNSSISLSTLNQLQQQQ
eukprot:403333794